MIIDTFPLGYGPEVLLLRLRTLVSLVDRHVIIEADSTFSGKPREPLWPVLAQQERFGPYVDRVHHVLISPPPGLTPWGREEWMRDASLNAVHNLGEPNPLVILGDADEIPNPGAVRIVESRGYERARLYGRYHEWYLDLRAVGSPYRWEHRQPIMFRLASVGDESGTSLRARQWHGSTGPTYQIGYPGTRRQAFAGWHFTLQGGADACREKLQAGAHTELSGLSTRRLSELAEDRKDILDRCPLERVHFSGLPAAVSYDPITFGPLLTREGVDEIDIYREDIEMQEVGQ
jgi:beta-1,4-mannosyl-glycoprotein beta-1,4-N-acetylglucosaminyltransferase